MVGKASPKVFGSLPEPQSGYDTTIILFFFAHLLILEYLYQFFSALPRTPQTDNQTKTMLPKT